MYDFSLLGRSILYHYLHNVCTSCTSYNDVLRPYKCTTDVLLQASILALFSGMHQFVRTHGNAQCTTWFQSQLYTPQTLHPSGYIAGAPPVQFKSELQQLLSQKGTQGNLYPLLQSAGKMCKSFYTCMIHYITNSIVPVKV